MTGKNKEGTCSADSLSKQQTLLSFATCTTEYYHHAKINIEHIYCNSVSENQLTITETHIFHVSQKLQTGIIPGSQVIVEISHQTTQQGVVGNNAEQCADIDHTCVMVHTCAITTGHRN